MPVAYGKRVLISIKLISLTAAGGALGAGMRCIFYLLARNYFPQTLLAYTTLLINIIGGIAIGFLITLLQIKWGSLPHTLLITGFLGGFTTFSTFSLEIQQMLTRHDYGFALTYSLGSVILSVFGVFFGIGSAQFLMRNL